MKEPRNKILKALISITVVLLVVIALYFIVRSLPLAMLGEVRPKRLVWWSFPLIAMLQIVFLFLAVETWRRVVRVLTGAHIDLWDSYMQLAVVTVGKYVPGKVWGFMARTADMYRAQIPVHLSLISSVVEQLLLMTGGLLVSMVAASIALPQYRVEIAVAGVLLLIVALIVIVKVPVVTQWLLRNKNIPNSLEKTDDYHAQRVFKFIIAYAVLWIITGLIFSIIYFSLFDTPIDTQTIAALILANTVGIVLGFFAFFIPGGIGIREAVSTGILAGFMPIREALLAAIIYRAWLIFIDGLNAVYILAREARLGKRTNADQTENP